MLSLGYRPDAFLEAYPRRACAPGCALHYAVEPEPLDTAGAIRFAALEAGIDDTLHRRERRRAHRSRRRPRSCAFHRDRGAEATIALTPVDDPSRFGVVPTDDDGRVIAFVEKPPRDEAPTNRINAGTYVLEPSVLDRIAGGRQVSIERETFPAMVADGTLYAMPTDAYWLDAGTPGTTCRPNLDLLDGAAAHRVEGVDCRRRASTRRRWSSARSSGRG